MKTIKTKHNDRLIATAPELLEALKNLIRSAERLAEQHAPEGNEPIWAWIYDAADVIARAEPRQHPPEEGIMNEKTPKRPVTMWLGQELETAERLWKSTTFRSRAAPIRATLRDGLERTARKNRINKE